MKIFSMTILPLLLIQEEHLSVIGDINMHLVLVICPSGYSVADHGVITLAVDPGHASKPRY